MFENMKWESVYELWEKGCYHFPKALTEPVSAETIFVECKQNDYYIYGYDWLEATEAQKRKLLIEKAPSEFLYFTEPTNKGTIRTAKELCDYRIGSDVVRYANILYGAACEFLMSRYYLWHHAMKRLVPEIMIPSSVIENIVCKDAEPVVGLIQMNTVLLKSAWSVLRYSSLKDGEMPESSCRIRSE